MMRVILHLYTAARALVAVGVPISRIVDTGLFDKVVRIKYEVPNDQLERMDGYIQEIDQALSALR